MAKEVSQALKGRYAEFENVRKLEGLLAQLAPGRVMIVGRTPQDRLLSEHALPRAGFKAMRPSANWRREDADLHLNERQIFVKSTPWRSRLMPCLAPKADEGRPGPGSLPEGR